jgi:hypothetical protein
LVSTFALRRFATSARCGRSVTVPAATSHGVSCASECCMKRCTGLSGSPDPALTSSFSRIACAVFLPSPSAEHFRIRLILSCACPLLQSLSSNSRPGLDIRAPSLGFRPSSRRHSAESTPAGIPSPLRSVLDVSHVLDGFLLCRACGFVSPRNHVQGSLFRGFPWQVAVRARRPPLPSCRSRCVPAPGFPRAPFRSARLQGLAPPASPSQGAVV